MDQKANPPIEQVWKPFNSRRDFEQWLHQRLQNRDLRAEHRVFSISDSRASTSKGAVVLPGKYHIVTTVVGSGEETWLVYLIYEGAVDVPSQNEVFFLVGAYRFLGPHTLRAEISGVNLIVHGRKRGDIADKLLLSMIV